MIDYHVQPMGEWDLTDVDCVITDPPFGIDFGSEDTYNRDEGNVVDGYVEWDESQYRERIEDLLAVIEGSLGPHGNALIFSGWNNSHVIHTALRDSDLRLEGKLYWSYNFAPYCSRRPAHNVYEIYWAVNGNDWTYTNECSYDHCTEGEANLSHFDVKRTYHKDVPKYPTRLPLEVPGILVEHFTEDGDTVFDPLAGSGAVGIAAAEHGRDAYLGDSNEAAKDVFEEMTDG